MNKPLLTHLDAEIQAISQFHETLQAEQKALVSNDVAALATISQTKQRQVDTLNRLTSERMRHLADLGFGSNENAVAQWLSVADEHERRAWDDLLNIASEANTCNQINGKLILQGMQHHQQALAILLAAANQVSLYGADGQPRGIYSGSGASRGIIGSA